MNHQIEGVNLAERLAEVTEATRVDLCTWNPRVVRATCGAREIPHDAKPNTVAVRDDTGALGSIELWGIDEDADRSVPDGLQEQVEEYLRRVEAEERRVVWRTLFSGFLHDIRGPLRHFSSLAAMSGEDEADRAAFAVAAMDECRAMERLLEAGQFLADTYSLRERRSCVLEDAWRRVLYMHECECDECGARIDSQLPANLRVGVDEVEFGRAFNELIDNSHKFASGDVVIRLSAEPGHCGGVLLRYRDESGGLKREFASKIFHAFYRGHSGGYQGAGLGLFLCREVIRKAGGWIELSESTNGAAGGMEFEIWLPTE